MTQVTDSDRMQQAPNRAFDWVVQELTFPSEQSRCQLRQAYLSNWNEGHAKGARELRKAWTTGIRWPSGESWLETENALDGDLQDLLFSRFAHVAFRIYRDAQVLHVMNVCPEVTQVIINKDAGHFREHDHCGFGFDVLMDAEKAKSLLLRPACAHPACKCSIDPVMKTYR